jgi:hypothetical protein
MLSTLFALLALVPLQAPKPDPFIEARRKWAYEFLDGAKVHLQLAKLHYDAGHFDLAQRLCEEALQRFGADNFDAVYRQVFTFPPHQGPSADSVDILKEIQDNLAAKKAIAAKATAVTAVKKWPKCSELWFYYGTAKDDAGQSGDAEFKKAAELAPSSAFIQGRVTERLLNKKHDVEAAFAGYLRTYFLDPHYQDSKPVALHLAEELGPKHSKMLVDKATAAGDLRTALSFDQYWGTERALKNIRDDWQQPYTADAVRMLAHDCREIRFNAMQTLRERADASFDPTLDQLLQHADPRVRGMALYIAIGRRGADAFPTAREFLASDCPLLRYDAISALLADGRGAALDIVRVHGRTETHEALKMMIMNRK